jgi:hypothetical protein
MADKLTLDDIADLRAYERERETFRDHVIALKKLRRIAVGPVVTILFENRETVRFQIQEMARAERMLSDEKIQGEIDAFNPLIPEAGQLRATMFLELTSKDELVEWLPKLVGVERSVELRLTGGLTVPCTVDPDHAAQLTREELTAAVHYIGFDLTPAEVEAAGAGPMSLAITHPAYAHVTELSEGTRSELLADVRGT